MVGVAFLSIEAISLQSRTVKTDLKKMAGAAAGLVDGDLHEKLSKASGVDSGNYARLLAPLVSFHRSVPEIAYLYTLVEKDGHFFFVLDTATAAKELGFNRPMKASDFLEPYQSDSPDEDRAEMEALRKGVGYVSRKPFSDEYGTFLTAVAPIKARDGRTVAILGLDMDMAEYIHRMGYVWVAVAIATGVVFFVSILVGVLVFKIRSKLKREEVAALLVHAEMEAVEERNRRLVSALGQIVYHYDASQKHMEWRGECEAILGYPPPDMPGGPDSWKKRIHPHDVALMEPWDTSNDGSEPALIREYRCFHKDGHVVWVLDRAVLTRDAGGNLLFVDGILLDITKRKQVEADLISARDAAEAAGRAKGDFLAVMSHEIRTPMNGVIGCANLLLETPLSTEQKEYLDTICKCGDSLLHLINDVLDFSKMESDKLTLEVRPFSLRLCVEEVLDLYGLMAAEKKIELVARFENRDLDWTSGDEVRFRQILVNLVGNALKFTTCGEVLVTLGRRPWLPAGDALMLSVKDTGVGIPENKQQGIFLPFSQADSSTTRKYGGTGLGLAICGRLAALMGGAITVHSEEGKGAEFVVLIPFPNLATHNPVYDTGLFRNKTALIVNGHPSFQMMMGDLLGAFGMRAFIADDLQKVKEHFNTGQIPDVLFFDSSIPSGTLCAIGETISSYKKEAGPKVVEMTVPSLLRSDRFAGMEVHGTLAKPVRKMALFQLLQNLFSGKPAVSAFPPSSVVSDVSMAEKFPLKILVVEDNAVNRKVVLQMLRRFGYAARFVENGKQCLDLLAAEPFDLVLMDIQMPEMDGYEATAALRKSGNATWVTALTADAMPEDPLRCRIAGMNDYLSKPVRVETLRAAVERCALSRKK